MREKNEITGYAAVENGMIHIPKVYLPEGVELRFRLELDGEFEIAFFLDKAENDIFEDEEICCECEGCPEADKCDCNGGY